MLNIWLQQLLYEENQKSGNVMQQCMNFSVCGIDTSSESIPIFQAINTFLSDSGTNICAKSK